MRLTKQMRQNILRKATANVPVIDYHKLLHPVLQKVICDHMPDAARAAYEDEASREYLSKNDVCVRHGNGYDGKTMWFYTHKFALYAPRSDRDIVVRIDDASFNQLKMGSMARDLSEAVRKTGYFEKHYEQISLLESVKERLRATLWGVSTVKRLYDVLEPELHHLIPKEENPAVANLPAKAGPVVDDLRKLGAQIADVPKVEK